MDQVIHLVAVATSQLLLLVFPPFIVARCWLRNRDWPAVTLAAIVMSFAAQGAAGLLWNDWIAGIPRLEAFLYLAFWLIASVVCLRRRRENAVSENGSLSPLESVGLAAILLLAFMVRSIHPLQHWALGQSDAYSHLQFVQDVVASGHIRNDIYPSGYHWVLALPALFLHLDPYYLARYGGAFFGIVLVLAVYVLGRNLASRPTAMFGAFLVAAFPGLQLLLKTGVGAFANQMGLCLIPAVFLFYFRWRSAAFALISDGVMLSIALLAMAVAVPMMLLHVLLLIALERFLALLMDRRGWALLSMKVILALLPAFAVLGVHVCHAGKIHRATTAKVLISVRGDDSQKLSPSVHHAGAVTLQRPLWFRMGKDFLSVKRLGYGDAGLNTAAVVLFVTFLGYLIVGMTRKSTFALLIGLWGVLAAVQAHTGFLQFSSYQREGWSLLIAVGCMGGHVAALTYAWCSRRFAVRAVSVLLMSAIAAWSLGHPPAHTLFSSSAEDDIVRFVRTLAGKEPAGSDSLGHGGREHAVLCELDPRLPLVLVSRCYAGFDNGQGDVVEATKGKLASISFTGEKSSAKIFRPGRQCVVLLDHDDNAVLTGYEIMLKVNRSLVQDFLNRRAAVMQLNNVLDGYLSHLDRDRWSVRRLNISSNLDVAIAIPVSMSSSGPEDAKKPANL